MLISSISQFSSTFLTRGAVGTLSGKNKPGGLYETVQRSRQSVARAGMGDERKIEMGVCAGIGIALPNVQEMDQRTGNRAEFC
jgi:hypothetical protein